MNNLVNLIKKPIFSLLVLLAVFGAVNFWLATPINTGFGLQPRFDWPDETANYFWIANYAKTGDLAVPEPLNSAAKNQIHPRSFNVRPDGALVPGSFLGLILFYGLLAKIFGLNLIIYPTPFLALFGVLAFFGVIKRIFDQKVALLAAILMLFHPAWWYYSAAPTLPNVSFISFLLISLYFLIKDKDADRLKFGPVFFSAFFAGLAFSFRPSEFLWLGALYLAIFFWFREKIKIRQVILFLTVVVLAVLPSVVWQQVLYGDFLASGYSQLQEGASASNCSVCQLTNSLLLPFGFHPNLIIHNFWNHYVSRTWWFSLLALLGLAAFLTAKRGQKDEIFGYGLFGLFLMIWLAIYYGSWQFSDLLTVNLNTLGLSYIRYWLPLFILVLPFAALALLWLTSLFRGRWKTLVLILLLAGLFYQSAGLVLTAKPDSLLPVRERIAEYENIAGLVNILMPPDAVIIAVRKDKVFFPERKVIHTFNALSLNQEILGLLPALFEKAPVYYYALGPEPALDLGEGLKLELIKSFEQEILYQVINK